MSSIRLRQDQIARLRKDGYGARCIAYALKRWRRGDFTITPATTRAKGADAPGKIEQLKTQFIS